MPACSGGREPGEEGAAPEPASPGEHLAERGAESEAGDPSGTSPGGPAELPPGQELERQLAGGETHSYRIPLEADQYVEIAAEQRGVDLVLELFAPGGRRLLAVDSPTGPRGAERLTAVAPESGTYRLEVRAWGGEEARGSYALRMEVPRPATVVDRRRAEADHLFAAAEELRRRADPASCRRALERYRQALEVALELGDRPRQAHIHQRIAWVHRKYLDEKRQAVPAYEQAIALFTETGDVWQQASAVNNLGRVHFDLGEMDRAFARWQQALELWRRAGDEAGEAAALNNLGLLYLTHGEVHEALGFYDRALERLHQIGSPRDETRVLHNRGQFYRSLGKHREALDDLDRALEIARELDDRPRQASALTAMGQVYEQMGRPEAAQAFLERALALRRQLGEQRGLALALRSLAAVDAHLGREEAALESLGQALTLFRGLEARRDEAVVLAQLGWLLGSGGRPEEALDTCRRALALFRQLGDPAGEATSLAGMARAERALGDLDAARRHAARSLERIEDLRGAAVRHDLRLAYFARQQDHFDFLIDLLMTLHRREPGAGHDAEALAVSERSRARSLLESLVESGAELRRGVAPDLVQRERELEQRLTALELQGLELRDPELLGGEPTPEQAQAAERQRRRLLEDYHEVRSRIRLESPVYASLTQPRPLSAAEIQRRVLDEETLLLAYDLGAERSYLWAVTTTSVASYELPGQSEIEAAARRTHQLLAASHQREARVQTGRALAELSRTLLGPAAGELAHRRLLIVGEGALQYIPFAALPVPEATGPSPSPAPGPEEATPLVAKHEVVHMPSASAVAVLRRQLAGREPAPGAVAVLADPVFEGAGGRRLEGLQHSRREAEAILALATPGESLQALGPDASRELATSPALGRYRIVHFATHGELDTEHPELSRLILSRLDARGRHRNGLLFAHEIYNLELPAELVVLSACRTALGKEVRGEGLVGLTQAFFYAGAARVLVSLWRVDDEATAELMARFYEALLVQGLAPAAALQAAQLGIRSETRWRAPYYWAGFVLQGEWRQLSTPRH